MTSSVVEGMHQSAVSGSIASDMTQVVTKSDPLHACKILAMFCVERMGIGCPRSPMIKDPLSSSIGPLRQRRVLHR